MTTTSDDDACLICFEPISIFAISKCGHHTCHRCYLRMRLLYKARSCKFCRADQNDVIFSTIMKPHNYFTKHLLPIFDTETGVYYTQVALKNQIDKITKYTCPQINCQVSFSDWRMISHHVTSQHKLYLCDICVENRTKFPDELQFYTQDQLKWHRREGDKAFRPADQSGFTGHVECKYCQAFFYGQTEFLEHSRHVHLECFLCKENERCNFFMTYEDLEEHFMSDHFICHHSTCMRQKFIVFGSREEWRQHQLALHDDSLATQLNKMHIHDDDLPTRNDVLPEYIPSFYDVRERIAPPRRAPVPPLTPELSGILNSEQVRKFKRHCWNFSGDYINVQDYVKGLYEMVHHNNEYVKILLEREVVAYLSNKKRTEAKEKWESYEHEVYYLREIVQREYFTKLERYLQINFPVLKSTTATAAESSTQGNNTTRNEPRPFEKKEPAYIRPRPKPKKATASRVLRIVSAPANNNAQGSSGNSPVANNNRRVNRETERRW